MKKNIPFWREALPILILCIINIAVRIPFAEMPAQGDEGNYFEGIQAIANNHLNPFVNFWGYKPPLMFLVPSFLFASIGQSLIWGRIEIYILSSFAILCTYLIGKRLYTHRTGLLAALLLLSYPPFMTQSLLFQDAIPLTSLFLATVYTYILRSVSGYVVAGSLLVLTKEHGIGLPILLFVHSLLGTRTPNNLFGRIRANAYLLLPLLVFIGWMIGNKFQLGWYLFPFNVDAFSLRQTMERALQGEIFFFLGSVFVRYGTWPIYVLIALAVYKTILPKYSQKNIWSQYKGSLLLVTLWIFFIVFQLFGPLSIRYVLFVYPLLFLVCVRSIERLFDTMGRYIVVGLLCIGFIGANLFHLYFVPANGENVDATLELMHHIQSSKSIIDKLQKYPDAVVLAAWPLYQQITNPLMGYVQTPISALNWDRYCQEYHPEEEAHRLQEIKETFSKTSTPVLFLYTSRSTCKEPIDSDLLDIQYIHNDPKTRTYEAIYKL